MKKILTPGDGVIFTEEDHSYRNKDGVRYTSGTQFINKFKPKFESEFWAKLKAYESLFDQQSCSEEGVNEINNYRKKAGFRALKKVPTLWKLIKTRKLVGIPNKKILSDCKKYASVLEPAFDLESEENKIRKKWKDKSKSSTDKGTDFHNNEEDNTRRKNKFWENWNMKDLNVGSIPSGEYPEMIIYNHKYKLAGMSDKVIIYNNNTVVLRDYKTSAKIDFEGFRNPYTKKVEKMLKPIQELDNCNFIHYTLQLSLYGWMLEQFGYKIDGMFIDFVEYFEDKDSGKILHKIKPIPVEYMPKTIKKMINYHEQHYA